MILGIFFFNSCFVRSCFQLRLKLYCFYLILFLLDYFHFFCIEFLHCYLTFVFELLFIILIFLCSMFVDAPRIIINFYGSLVALQIQWNCNSTTDHLPNLYIESIWKSTKWLHRINRISLNVCDNIQSKYLWQLHTRIELTKSHKDTTNQTLSINKYVGESEYYGHFIINSSKWNHSYTQEKKKKRFLV